jgi:transcriptional regulator with XRE-family HTH domain
MILGERINYLRTARGWSLEQLADAAGGLQKGYLRDIEAGKQHPSPTTLEKLAAALQMPIDELLGKTGRELTLDEQTLLDAYRSGDTIGAIRIIMAKADK